MNEFLREIQEDIQREKWMTLWERYGKFAIALVVAIVVTVSAFKAWQAYDEKQAQKATSALIAAASTPSAEAYGKVAAEAPADIAAVAKFLQAAELAQTNPQAAAKLHEEIAASRADSSLVELAHALNGTGTPKEQDAFYQSQLERAGYDAIAKDDLAAAKNFFTRLISSDNAPATLKSRSEQVLAWLNQQQAADRK